MAAASLALSVCTATGPATMSVASVSACQDSLEPCATKVPSSGGKAREGHQGAERREGPGVLSLHCWEPSGTYVKREKVTVPLKARAQRS